MVVEGRAVVVVTGRNGDDERNREQVMDGKYRTEGIEQVMEFKEERNVTGREATLKYNC